MKSGRLALLKTLGTTGVVMSSQSLAATHAKQLFQYLFEQASLGIAVEDLEGKILFANPALHAMLGYAENELCGMSCSQFANPEDSEDDWALFQRLRAGSISRYSLEKRYVRKDGGRLWGRLNVSLLKDRDGGLSPLVFAFVEDITERKRTDEVLCESEGKLRLILDSTAEAIYGIDLEHRCTFCNPACLRTLGYERRDQVLGKNMHDLIHHHRSDGTLFPAEECRIHRATQAGEGVHAENELMWRANGTSFPVEYWSYPQRKGDHVVGGSGRLSGYHRAQTGGSRARKREP